MIYDHVDNINCYLRIDPNLDTVIREIQSGEYTAWESGRHDIKGNDAYCNVTTVKYTENPLWERHEKYLDIHINLEGTEQIQCENINMITDWSTYNPEGDYSTAPDTKTGTAMEMRKGMFLIVFPQDAHMPGLVKTAGQSRKVIFKAKLSDDFLSK